MVQVGGPYWHVPLGRKDSKTASFTLANENIPLPDQGIPSLISSFLYQGLSVTDMVALVGMKLSLFWFCFPQPNPDTTTSHSYQVPRSTNSHSSLQFIIQDLIQKFSGTGLFCITFLFSYSEFKLDEFHELIRLSSTINPSMGTTSKIQTG